MDTNQEVIVKKISKEILKPEYRLKSTHYANGNVLHSDQYYFAKKFFQNSKNCQDIARLLEGKAKQLKFDKQTTFVGFRDYLGILLKMAVTKMPTYNYEILEDDSDSYMWRNKPVLKKNVVVVLPITCSCGSFFKIRNFITKYIESNKFDSVVNSNFINIFLILDESLQHTAIVKIDELNPEEKVYKIYNPFKWKKLTQSQIIFDDAAEQFVANPLVRLYSEMYLPEDCALCFPENQTEEKVLFPTNINFESPNLIFGFPNFKRVNNDFKFFDIFSSDEGRWHTHLHGNIDVNGNNYLNFIRANAFYDHNENAILNYFDHRLRESNIFDTSDKIIIITPETKHSCNFLDDLLIRPVLVNSNVTILRFQPSTEFIDNFISIYTTSISTKGVKIIYFEEIMTSAVAFKLLSDYITHCRHDQPGENAFHGFDLVLTLIDRTTFYTKKEVLKKIESHINITPQNNFIAFYTLNSPIILARYLGNPLSRRLEVMKKMMGLSQLDSLRQITGEKIMRRLPKKISQIDSNPAEHEVNFYPFTVLEKEPFSLANFELYKSFSQEKLNLLRLYLTHELNSFLGQELYQSNDYADSDQLQTFLNDVFDYFENKHSEFEQFFMNNQGADLAARNIAAEKILVRESIIKLFSHYPFVYYKNIYEVTFNYCNDILDSICNNILTTDSITFTTFRTLKFYLRRSVELNSNFIISDRFLRCVEKQHTNEGMAKINTGYERKIGVIKSKPDIDETYRNRTDLNLHYKWRQMNSYLVFLLFCYKDIVFKNPSRSIRLERLIKQRSPQEATDLKNLIRDPYFHFLGMLKIENIYLLDELKSFYKADILDNEKNMPDKKNLRKENIYKHFFGKEKNDPAVLNSLKLIDESM
jgi:hypothetical protein